MWRVRRCTDTRALLAWLIGLTDRPSRPIYQSGQPASALWPALASLPALVFLTYAARRLQASLGPVKVALYAPQLGIESLLTLFVLIAFGEQQGNCRDHNQRQEQREERRVAPFA